MQNGRAEHGTPRPRVKGDELDKKDQVIDMVVVRRKSTRSPVTEKGMGKRSELDDTG